MNSKTTTKTSVCPRLFRHRIIWTTVSGGIILTWDKSEVTSVCRKPAKSVVSGVSPLLAAQWECSNCFTPEIVGQNHVQLASPRKPWEQNIPLSPWLKIILKTTVILIGHAILRSHVGFALMGRSRSVLCLMAAGAADARRTDVPRDFYSLE